MFYTEVSGAVGTFPEQVGDDVEYLNAHVVKKDTGQHIKFFLGRFFFTIVQQAIDGKVEDYGLNTQKAHISNEVEDDVSEIMEYFKVYGVGQERESQ